MPKVLFISAADLRAALGATVLWRQDIEREFAPDLESGMAAMRATTPNLVVLDGPLAVLSLVRPAAIG